MEKDLAGLLADEIWKYFQLGAASRVFGSTLSNNCLCRGCAAEEHSNCTRNAHLSGAEAQWDARGFASFIKRTSEHPPETGKFYCRALQTQTPSSERLREQALADRGNSHQLL